MGEENKDNTPHEHRELREQWKEEQLKLKQKLIMFDDFDWGDEKGKTPLKLIGGVDISFSEEDSNKACASIVVLSYPDMKVKYSDFMMVYLDQPYIPGFLAFREVPALTQLVADLRERKPQFVPQVIIVDGNGVLHTRGFGLASHFGVLVDIPTIGVAKKFFNVDGLMKDEVRDLCRANLRRNGDWVFLRGKSGAIWGTAMLTADSSTNPVYVSIGHRISLETASHIVHISSRYRIPEPTRQADLLSRKYLREIRDGYRHSSSLKYTSYRDVEAKIKEEEAQAEAKSMNP
eukprot:TRINITY_DN9693_c0_g1_i2.p1 TRINITY_DN9693_c0_g1~~TRINITY_DN9693_c0_g1_i2.p1  ORF type:complete len:300 (-),score=82.84 TRINITY_DN9693_c0_g1_i2:287-1156(-)